jgi:hypothetical protein
MEQDEAGIFDRLGVGDPLVTASRWLFGGIPGSKGTA